MATDPKTTKAAREHAAHAAYTAAQQTDAEAAATDQVNGGRCVTALEMRALLDLIADLRRAASAAGWLDEREAT